MVITVEQLEAWNAGSEDVEPFVRAFGWQAKVTPRNVEKARELDLDCLWLAAKLAANWGLIVNLRNAIMREMIFSNTGARCYDANAIVLLIIAQELDYMKELGDEY